ncbi:MAG: hypothetical protein AAF804_06945 [Bacteroidota bacterium]
MSNRSTWSVSPLGLLPGWGTAAGFAYWVLHADAWGYALAGILALLQLLGLYLLAARWSNESLGEFFRGWIIGLNAGLNAWLVSYLFGHWIYGGVLGAVVSASSILRISRHPQFQLILGWVNWWLPMSWPVNLPGALMMLANLFFLPLGYLHPLFRPIRIRLVLDLPSGSLTCYGGLIRPIAGFSGLNMGNFIFINPGFEHLQRHEIGHLFSLAAMGGPFHYIGGVDEAMWQKNYWEAYAEHLADSYSTPTASVRSIWG